MFGAPADKMELRVGSTKGRPQKPPGPARPGARHHQGIGIFLRGGIVQQMSRRDHLLKKDWYRFWKARARRSPFMYQINPSCQNNDFPVVHGNLGQPFAGLVTSPLSSLPRLFTQPYIAPPSRNGAGYDSSKAASSDLHLPRRRRIYPRHSAF